MSGRFSCMGTISQATLSELEQGRYNSSLETILSIHIFFNTNLQWLLVGDTLIEDSEEQALFNVSLDDTEIKLVDLYRSLIDHDKEEISHFMRLKIDRYC
ncbi:XRE family transcriptional regulator [Paenibacillus marinisediminis]